MFTRIIKSVFIFVLITIGSPAAAADNSGSSKASGGISINLGTPSKGLGNQQVATGIKVLLVLTVLSLAPSLLVMLTAFTRIIIILSMLRHAFGMQQTPPNVVLISLALFLTLFTMMPVVTQINDNAMKPYAEGKIDSAEALKKGMGPLREFMVKQMREKDLLLVLELAKAPKPKTIDDVSTVHLVTAFMLSELKTAFQIGFVIFIPFLLVDLVVASILMSMGMIMVPPMMISLPIKILMFVLIEGWLLVTQSIIGSFH